MCVASGPASVGLRLGSMLLELKDASVGMIDNLGEKEQVIATEVAGVLPFLAVLVKTGEGDAVPRSGFRLVRPYGGLDRADAHLGGFLLVGHGCDSFEWSRGFSFPGEW